MPLGSVSEWMDEHTREDGVWYVKRLSGNDTLANGSHQGGPYVPKPVLFSIFPSMQNVSEENPDQRFELYLDSHPDVRTVRAVWYNNKFRGGTRDEARITGFGGKSSPLLDPESTGAIAVFAFQSDGNGSIPECHVWISHDELEEDLIEARTGPIEPGTWITMAAGRLPTLALDERQRVRASCRLLPDEITAEWQSTFPSAVQIFEKALLLRPAHGMNPDQRLLARRRCEFEIFRSVEDALELPRLRDACFDVDGLLDLAQGILQRRRARAGVSLSLHTRRILLEEGFREGSDFELPPEAMSSPLDFLFPNYAAFGNRTYPSSALRSLSVMVTCRDRWRQVLTAGERPIVKHVLTLQEGVSENQYREMAEANILLVVPEALRDSYPPAVRPQLLSIESFIADLRLLH